MRGPPPGQEPDAESPGARLRLNGHGAQRGASIGDQFLIELTDM
jgi:hypothetical protein